MKCVCPMGGDRTCPDSCPLAVWANLSPADRKAQRKAIAERLYKQNMTMEQIATQLGVSHPTIVRDLKEFVHDEQTQSRTSKRGRKDEGRPKGSGKGTGRRRNHTLAKGNESQRDLAVSLFLDKGKTREEACAETGFPSGSMQMAVERERGVREAKADPEIDPKSLSITSREKLDAAMRQHKRKLELQFSDRVSDEVRKRLEDTILPHYSKTYADYKAVLKSRKGCMDRATYKKILACLHPDRVQDAVLKKRYEEAFRLFTELEKVVLNEKESPTSFIDIPSTYEDLTKAKAAATAARRTKRANGRSAVSARHA